MTFGNDLFLLFDRLDMFPDIEVIFGMSPGWLPGVPVGDREEAILLLTPERRLREPVELRVTKRGSVTVVELLSGNGRLVRDFTPLAKELVRRLNIRGESWKGIAEVIRALNSYTAHMPDLMPLSPLKAVPPLRVDVIAPLSSLPPEARKLVDEVDGPPSEGDRLVDTRGWNWREAKLLVSSLKDHVTGWVVESPSSYALPLLARTTLRARLLYTDPPWGTGRDFTYMDALHPEDWMNFMHYTFFEAKPILLEDANVLLHVSPEASYLAHGVLEELYRFNGEIVWHYRTGGAPSKKAPLARKHDTILHYSKGPKPFFHRLKERVYYEKSFFTTQKDDEGRTYADVVLRDVIGEEVLVVEGKKVVRYNTKPVINVSKERVKGFHTQKPEGLLALLVRIFTEPGDVVLDPFGGTGTTAVAALKMGRRFAVIEKAPSHVRIILSRLLDAITISGREPCGITEMTGYGGGGIVGLLSVDFERFLHTPFESMIEDGHEGMDSADDSHHGHDDDTPSR